MSHSITTLIGGAARKAWVAFREGRLPLSPSSWLRDLARHWREEGAWVQSAGPHRTDQKRLDESYSRWRQAHPEDAAPDSGLEKLTIVVLVDDPEYADEIVSSAQSQSFDRWELWLVHQSRDSISGTRAPYRGGDSRIREWTLEAGLSDEWIPPGDSPHLVLLDTTTVLAPGALARIAGAAHHTGADWIFTDDDRLDASGGRTDPNLKGDFSPELALVDDYATRLAVASRSAVERCGGLRRELRNAQIYDLLLRIVEQNGRVHHLAEVCAHRRNIGSAVLSDYHHRAAEQVLMRRCGPASIAVEAPTRRTPFSTQRVAWQKTWRPTPRITIIIPTRDRVDFLRACVESVIRTVDPVGASLLIVDDESQDDSAIAYLASLERELPLECRVMRHRRADVRFNYAALINAAAREVHTPLMLHLNNDVEALSRGWLEQMVGWLSCPQVGVVGAKLLYNDGSLQHAGVLVRPDQIPEHLFHRLRNDDPGYQWLPHRVRNVSAVTGACLLTRTDLFNQVGGFDQDNLSVQFNDIDYCLKVLAVGRRIVYEPAAMLSHVASVSRGTRHDHRENLYFLSKYRGYRDPFVSPLLDPASLFDASPMLACD